MTPRRSSPSRLLADSLAPTNFLLTNPAALRRALETGGWQPRRGRRNFLDDLVSNGGRPRQVDNSSFEVGRNLAATPGKVVFRNELMELIQYAPQTEQVHAVPLLCSPAVDQQVLRDGPGARAQLPRMGGAARAHGVRDQLPQPGRRRCAT